MSLPAYLLSFSLVTAAGMAAQADGIPTNKQTGLGLYLGASEAAAMLAADEDVLFVDIRSRAEVSFVGLPTAIGVHIPYMVMPSKAAYNAEKGTYMLEMNPDFIFDFMDYADEHGVTPETPIILMCRSGSRSARAADALAEMGYTRVFSLVDGFEGDKVPDGRDKGKRLVNGWRNAGLEWSYTLSEQQVYPADR